jgi:S1-C subfamily serine protease
MWQNVRRGRNLAAALAASLAHASTAGGAGPGDAARRPAGPQLHLAASPAPVPAELARYASLADMIEAVWPSLCKIQGAVGDRELGGGSGFVVSEDGIVVSNAHVFSAMPQMGAREIRATFDDGRSFRVEQLAADAEADIAIGRLVAPPGTRFQPLRVGRSSALRRGDPVVVLGAPLGGSLVPAVGVLGGSRYVADDETMTRVLNSRADWSLLQVDANMSSGSSGGPIVNSDGEVVAVSVDRLQARYECVYCHTYCQFSYIHPLASFHTVR